MTDSRSQSEQQAEICHLSQRYGHYSGTYSRSFRGRGHIGGGEGNQRVRPKAYIPIKLACMDLVNLSCNISHLEKKLIKMSLAVGSILIIVVGEFTQQREKVFG